MVAPLPIARVRQLAEGNHGPDVKALANEVLESRERVAALFILRPLSEYDDGLGSVLWHHLPIQEPPEVCGSPCDLPEGYPDGWHTHWSPLPDPRFMAATDGAELDASLEKS